MARASIRMRTIGATSMVLALLLLGVIGTLGHAQPRPSRAHTALNNAIDCYRRGDYELAATFFQQAQAGREDLSGTERQDLANQLQRNNIALHARRQGVEQLHRAEAAVQAGRIQDANALMKEVTANHQFLTAANKLRARQLTDVLRPGATAVLPAAGSDGKAAALVRARAKLQQARAMLAKENYDAAETLAREAEDLKAVYTSREDTPRKVLADVAVVRNAAKLDVKGLLQAARTAFERGDIDRAEQLARQAEKATSFWSFHLWRDSPAKVLKDVQSARVKLAAGAADPSSSKTTPTLPREKTADEPSNKNSLQLTGAAESSDMAPAEAVPEPAQGPAGDNTEIRDQGSGIRDQGSGIRDQGSGIRDQGSGIRDQGSGTSASVSDWEPDGLRGTQDKASSRALLQRGRELYRAGKLAQAKDLAQQARTAGSTRWGLFEDSPDKLLLDIQKSHTRRDQEESTLHLAEARKLFEAGDLDAAESKAYEAERLHGPYSIWDLGDRPHKLIAAIDSARAKNRQVKLPPAPRAPAAGKSKITRTNPQAPLPVWPGEPRAEDRLHPGDREVQTSGLLPAGYTAPAGAPPAGPSSPPTWPGDRSKPPAQQLLAEARSLQAEGRLVEARRKALEAQQTGALFGPEEDRPERALLELASICDKWMDNLLRQATDHVLTADRNPEHFQKAEADLMEARQLAVGFGLDTHPIDSKAVWVRQKRAQASASAGHPEPAGQAEATDQPDTPQRRVQELMDKARLELHRGETATARRLAEEVFTGPHGLQAEATALLRSIDVEEFNQRSLAADRAFEAGRSAFLRKDYNYAAAIFRTFDPRMLKPDKQAKLKELVATPEMQPTALAAGRDAGRDAATPGRGDMEKETSGRVPPILGQESPGQATASDQPSAKPVAPADSYARQVQALQEVKFQQLREDGQRALREALERFQAGDTDRALEILHDHSSGLETAQLEPSRLALLRRPIEVRLQQFKTLKVQRDMERDSHTRQASFGEGRARRAMAEEQKNKQVAELLKQSNDLRDLGKYAEAELAAAQAQELEPENTAAGAALHIARTQRNLTRSRETKHKRQDMFTSAMDEAEDPGPAVSLENPLAIDEEVHKRSQKRQNQLQTINLKVKNEKEREIERRLNLPVPTLDFKDTPLGQVIDDLGTLTNINIIVDQRALDEEGISLNRPVTLHLGQVALKSALNILLHQVHLTYVIQDEVLKITTEKYARGKLVLRQFSVGDLLVPVTNHVIPVSANLSKMLNQKQGGLQPYAGPNSLANGTPVSSPGSGLAAGNGTTASATLGAGPSQSQPMQETLIKLITNTIRPESWSDVGGPGTIDYFPLGMGLVVNQTPDVLDQVAELLESLRRLQDLSVAVEVRLISLSESYFERIGLDFSVNIKTDTAKFEPQITSGQFKGPGLINDFEPSNFISGLTPAGHFTSDLDIPIRSSSFNQAIPPFGGFQNMPGANGGLGLGLAFLSDIQVFMFMEAAQGDRRVNTMQAPKLTLFNGQTANISINDVQYFVTDLAVIQSGGQLVFLPTNTPFPLGVTLTLQAVVSADRRFVRLNLAPSLTNLSSATVPLFPITTFITPVFEGGYQGQPIPFTQFIQQPTFTSITLETTVSVPDGGTVLLGGLKLLNEGRNEFGPPILSKIPYLNRLFKNVGYGRDTSTLMIMVTPRIIINAEEEFRQTGEGAPTP